MREVAYNKQIDPEKRVKKFSIDSKTEDEKSKTRVKKSFKYTVDPAKVTEAIARPPLVFIRKNFDTKRGIEHFSFHVKGYFFIKHEERMVKVRFYHTLDITIRWKAMNFSPNKSESLT